MVKEFIHLFSSQNNSEIAEKLASLANDYEILAEKYSGTKNENELIVSVNCKLLAIQYTYLRAYYKAIAMLPDFGFPSMSVKPNFDIIAKHHKDLINLYTEMYHDTKDKMYLELKEINEKYYRASVEMLNKLK